MKNISNVFKYSVCTIGVPGALAGGQGILIRPDLLLTSAHVLTDKDNNKMMSPMPVVNEAGMKAYTLPDDPQTVLSDIFEVDAALIKISVPLASAYIPYARDNKVLEGPMSLVTRFAGALEAHDIALAVRDEAFESVAEKNFTTFQSNIGLRGGYSGSPILDEFGRICSITKGIYKEIKTDDGTIYEWPYDAGAFIGPNPETLSAFLDANLK